MKDPIVIKSKNDKKIVLTDGTELVDFISCSYFGLDTDIRIIEAVSDGVKKHGTTFPIARSSAVMEPFNVLEELLNQVFCHSYTIVFPSLHLAHLSCLPVLAASQLPGFPLRRKPVFIVDSKVHPSISIILSQLETFGKIIILDFHFFDKLEQQLNELKQQNVTPVVIADSISSLGEFNLVSDLIKLVEIYDGYIYLDDAHGTSVYGKNGSGYVLDQLRGYFHSKLILASSLSKGFGTVGGVIALPSEEDAYALKKCASPYIYGGPPPLAVADAGIVAAKIHLSAEIYELQDKLRSNIQHFNKIFQNYVYNNHLVSPIRIINNINELSIDNLILNLRENGFAIGKARYKFSKLNTEVVRIMLSSKHTEADIERLYSNLIQIIESEMALIQ